MDRNLTITTVTWIKMDHRSKMRQFERENGQKLWALFRRCFWAMFLPKFWVMLSSKNSGDIWIINVEYGKTWILTVEYVNPGRVDITASVSLQTNVAHKKDEWARGNVGRVWASLRCHQLESRDQFGENEQRSETFWMTKNVHSLQYKSSRPTLNNYPSWAGIQSLARKTAIPSRSL